MIKKKSLFFATSVQMFLYARLLIYKNINTVPKLQIKMVKVLKFASMNTQHNKSQCTEYYRQLHFLVWFYLYNECFLMQSFKLKNSRRRADEGACRQFGQLSAAGESRYKPERKVPEGPWTPKQAKEAQQRDVPSQPWPARPGHGALCQTAAPRRPRWWPEPQPRSATSPRASVTLQARLPGSVLSFPSPCLPRPRHASPGWYPSPVTPPNSVLPLLDRDAHQHPRRKRPPPLGSLTVLPSPAESKVTSFTTPYPKSAFSTIFILFWSIILKLIPVCAIFNYFKLIGSSSNWTGGLRGQAVFWAFWHL